MVEVLSGVCRCVEVEAGWVKESRKWGEGDRAIRYGNGRFQLSASPLPFSSFSHRRAAFPKMNLGKQQKWTHYSIVPVFNVFISSVKKEVQIYPENWLPLLLKHLPKLAAFLHWYQKKIKVYTTGTARWAIISQRKMAFQISHSRGCFFFFFSIRSFHPSLGRLLLTSWLSFSFPASLFSL